MRVTSDVDTLPLREIYLRAFQPVAERGPRRLAPFLPEAMGDKVDEHFLRIIGPNAVGQFEGLPLPLAEMEKMTAGASRRIGNGGFLFVKVEYVAHGGMAGAERKGTWSRGRWCGPTADQPAE
ncbi:hypothetical protein StoSoilB20_19660 [Arthrobacter sp. StoSoilB20]|nr:hypothetical protein StoSoilB20_19660 [Arthrobacter sp. StoSoilB20]